MKLKVQVCCMGNWWRISCQYSKINAYWPMILEMWTWGDCKLVGVTTYVYKYVWIFLHIDYIEAYGKVKFFPCSIDWNCAHCARFLHIFWALICIWVDAHVRVQTFMHCVELGGMSILHCRHSKSIYSFINTTNHKIYGNWRLHCPSDYFCF